MVTAIVLIRATMGRTPDIAEALLQLPEVSEVYSVTGEYDLVAMVRVQQYDQMADAVPSKLASKTGRRPYLSDNRPRIGANTSCMME